LIEEAASQAFCSTANLGAGFDSFGLALKKYADQVQVRITGGRKIRIVVKGAYSTGVPREINRNSAGPPAQALLRRTNLRKGLEIIVEKNVPQGLGLGSSGATAAACTKCLDHLLELGLDNDELVRVASLGERAVTGAAHADNVAASLLGGFVIAYGDPIRTISIQPPKGLAIVVVTPSLPVRDNKTRMARKLVPANLSTRKAVLNIGRASAIATGFARGNIEMIGSGMQDEIAEPHRERLVPAYRQVKEAALTAGASGVSISGAGPSVIALVDKTGHDPKNVAKEMTETLGRNGTRSGSFITVPAPGARIIRG
jgi:homoserine kinase